MKVPVIQALEVTCVVPSVPLPDVDDQFEHVSGEAVPPLKLPVYVKASTTVPVSSFFTPLTSGDTPEFHNAARLFAMTVPSIL